MIVVSDTSPLRALDHLGLSALPHILFGDVVIPPAVEWELRFPPARFSAVEPASFPGVQIQAPTDAVLVQQLCQSLDLGEAEAIALAIERKADAILIDETAGRAEALQRGLVVTGTAGVLLLGKRAGEIPAVAPLLDELRTSLGFHLTDALIAQVRQFSERAAPLGSNVFNPCQAFVDEPFLNSFTNGTPDQSVPPRKGLPI